MRPLHAHGASARRPRGVSALALLRRKGVFVRTRSLLDKVRVVILGQDPYHGPGQAAVGAQVVGHAILMDDERDHRLGRRPTLHPRAVAKVRALLLFHQIGRAHV